MRVIIAMAKVHEKNVILDAIKESGFPVESIVIGNRDAEDVIDDIVMKENVCKHMRICMPSPSIWKDEGRMRNLQWMINSSDALIAIWDGISQEIHKIVQAAYEKNLKVFVKMAF